MTAIYISPPQNMDGRKFFNFPLLADLKTKQKGQINIFDSANKAILHEVIGEVSKVGVVPS